MQIKLTQIFVDDQDAAREFFTEKLGFLVKTDAAYSPDERWLSVVSPEAPDGLELLLSLPDDTARAFRDSLHDSGTPATAFVTTDIDKDYAQLLERGVTFTLPPTRMDYGGIDAMFEDGQGNYLALHQD
jgi:catechol 2,3-dioxygenase-like lactoylglutathione lyase family enzyme